MTLINTDGMALIGPGSEWFWTAFSGVVLAVTFLAIYRQLRLQSHQAAIEQLERIEHEFASERMARWRLEILYALRDGVDRTLLPSSAASGIINFWERVGSLARRGRLDMDLLWEGGSGFYSQADWVRLAPTIQRDRIDQQNPEIASFFEWLVRQMEARARRQGVALADEATLAEWLDRSIATLEQRVRTEEALRAVVPASPGARPVPSVAAVPPTAVGAAEG